MQVLTLSETAVKFIEKQQVIIKEQAAAIDNLTNVSNEFRLHLQNQIKQADILIQQKQNEISSIYASTSWKITKLVRFFGKLIKQNKNS